MQPGRLGWKKNGVCVLLAGILVLGAAGCGEKNGDETKITPSVQPEITEPAPQPTEPAEPTRAAAAEPTEPVKEVRTNFYVSTLDEEIPSLGEEGLYFRGYRAYGERSEERIERGINSAAV